MHAERIRRDAGRVDGAAPGLTDGTAPVLTTSRLTLRGWRDSDRALFAALNADPRVMEYFLKPLDRAESDALAARIDGHLARRGFGLWAVEIPGVAEFIGFVGLSVPGFDAPFMPCVEIGWRLAAEHWGRGYATEAARAVVSFGFGRLALSEIVSFTAPANVRSRHVMDRLGMTHSSQDDFDSPSLPVGHALRRQVLYRLPRDTRQDGIDRLFEQTRKSAAPPLH